VRTLAARIRPASRTVGHRHLDRRLVVRHSSFTCSWSWTEEAKRCDGVAQVNARLPDRLRREVQGLVRAHARLLEDEKRALDLPPGRALMPPELDKRAVFFLSSAALRSPVFVGVARPGRIGSFGRGAEKGAEEAGRDEVDRVAGGASDGAHAHVSTTIGLGRGHALRTREAAVKRTTMRETERMVPRRRRGERSRVDPVAEFAETADAMPLQTQRVFVNGDLPVSQNIAIESTDVPL